jgi:AcrR family transcriptional regulator
VSPSARDRVIEAALSLIAEYGLAGVTMTMIAETAAVTRQTLYNHFPDLDTIISTALESHAEAAARQLEDLLESSPNAVVKIEQLVRHGTSHSGHELGTLAAGLSPEAQARIDHHLRVYQDIIAGVIEDGIGEKVFRRELDAAAATVVVIRMLEASPELNDRLGGPADTADLLIEMITGSLSAK